MGILKTNENSPYTITLPIFEGPLDLLLHLIHEHKLDIYDIPIAHVTQQYLTYLCVMEAMDLDVAGEWLVMAATLVEIKSRMLLPRDETEPPGEEEENIDPRLELVERLIEYEKFKGAADLFREKEAERSRYFVRHATELDFNLKPQFDLEDISAEDLLDALQKILQDVGEGSVTTLQKRKITVKIRMREIIGRIENADGQLTFFELFEDDGSKTEVVITFLALLELLRSRRVEVSQKGAFAPITVSAVRTGDGREQTVTA